MQGRGHGKIILFGEHSVVYGRPALAAALSRGVSATASPADEDQLVISAWDLVLTPATMDDASADSHHALRVAFAALLEAYAQRPSLRIEAQLELPGSAGLGASAALSVAVVRAIDAALGHTRSDDAVAEIALRAERVFHGNPSGIDSAMAAAGGLCLYRKADGIKPVTAGRVLPLVVGHSGEAGRTKDTVASVARQHQRDPAKLDEIFDAIEAVVNNGKTALERGELSRLGQLMDLNQKLLATMLLSTTRLEEMCKAARAAGALGAKLTGGGGGGCMIALCEDLEQAQVVQRALGDAAFVTEAGG